MRSQDSSVGDWWLAVWAGVRGAAPPMTLMFVALALMLAALAAFGPMNPLDAPPAPIAPPPLPAVPARFRSKNELFVAAQSVELLSELLCTRKV
eukprot:SAG31_NODE_435_length_15733_cov_6.508251_14_plen_94_part_00